jgi:hypothetical protein
MESSRSLLSHSKEAPDLLGLSKYNEWAGKGKQGMKAALRLLSKSRDAPTTGEKGRER